MARAQQDTGLSAGLLSKTDWPSPAAGGASMNAACKLYIAVIMIILMLQIVQVLNFKDNDLNNTNNTSSNNAIPVSAVIQSLSAAVTMALLFCGWLSKTDCT